MYKIGKVICMLAPVLLAPFKGRYWCGNFCPRGSFYDNVIFYCNFIPVGIYYKWAYAHLGGG